MENKLKFYLKEGEIHVRKIKKALDKIPYSFNMKRF